MAVVGVVSLWSRCHCRCVRLGKSAFRRHESCLKQLAQDRCNCNPDPGSELVALLITLTLLQPSVASGRGAQSQSRRKDGTDYTQEEYVARGIWSAVCYVMCRGAFGVEYSMTLRCFARDWSGAGREYMPMRLSLIRLHSHDRQQHRFLHFRPWSPPASLSGYQA